MTNRALRWQAFVLLFSFSLGGCGGEGDARANPLPPDASLDGPAALTQAEPDAALEELEGGADGALDD
jgi:hypothetical protein